MSRGRTFRYWQGATSAGHARAWSWRTRRIARKRFATTASHLPALPVIQPIEVRDLAIYDQMLEVV